MSIHTDERFRERVRGIGDNYRLLEKHCKDFNFCEEKGKYLASVQQRNMEAVTEILIKLINENVVIGTHGTALSTILNYYASSFGCDEFKRKWKSLHYIIRLDFEGEKLISTIGLLKVDRGNF